MESVYKPARKRSDIINVKIVLCLRKAQLTVEKKSNSIKYLYKERFSSRLV